MPYRVGLYTLGCKVSQYETEAVAEAFEEKGFVRTPFEEICDVYVVNTCTVTAESDRKSRQVIRRAKRKNPDAVVMVMGCYSQRAPEALLKLSGVSYVIGTEGKMRLPDKALALLKAKERVPEAALLPLEGAAFEPMTVKSAPRTRAYVKIEDGCECACTYCAISLARGGVRSKRADDVLAEVEGLCRGGTREVVLTGIETSSYGRDFEGYGLIDLLERFERESPIARIRLGSLSPEWLKKGVIDRLSRLSKITPHFHISVQSGSSSVLARMKRRYNRDMALESMLYLRERMPEVEYTADMMVGFPGETQEEFADTLDFARRVAFLSMHVFAYSQREGTPAAYYDNQVAEEIKRQRSEALIALAASLSEERRQRVIEQGAPLRVLFETCRDGVWRGHSDTFLEVEAPSSLDLHGQLCAVLPLSVKEGRIWGRLL